MEKYFLLVCKWTDWKKDFYVNYVFLCVMTVKILEKQGEPSGVGLKNIKKMQHIDVETSAVVEHVS